ncbi:MAG: HlyD family efflux transporter periplasmic adaptor subunit [Lachnospiraceae bacterium]|nr:HlyD family efflux transporter periplasmic adaptor subunit [Lachnospiraceae bacterium]
MNFMSENENENITPVTEEMPEAVQYDEEEENSGDTEYPEYDEDETEEQVIPKKKNFFLRHKVLSILLIILIIGAVLIFAVIIPKIKAAQDALNTKTQKFEDIEKRNIANSIAVTGTVKAKESRTVSTLVANTKVVSVSVEVGDHVTAGQEICVFDKDNLLNKIENLEKQMNVTQAKSDETVINAQVDVNKANTTLANDYVDNSTNVARMQQAYDDALKDYYNACDGFEAAKKARDEAKTAYDGVQGGYNEAKSRYDALPDGVKAGSVSADATQTAIMKDYTYWSQQNSSLKTAYESAASKVSQFESSIASAETKVRTAKQNLDDAKIKTDRSLIADASNVATSELSQSTKNIEATTTNDNNRETMDSYQTQLEGYVITAPISGIVTSLSVAVGDEFSTNAKTEVCVIQDDSEWIIEGTVDQYDISSVQKGMKAVVKTDSTGDEEMSGEVTFVSPVPATSSSGSSTSSTQSSSGSTTANYPVKIRLDERDDRLRIGMTAETSVILDQAEDVYAVPYDCIKEREDGTFYITVTDAKGESKAAESANGFGEKTAPDDKKNMKGKERASKGNDMAGEAVTRDITVKKGLETDYYTEIISDELKDGLKVLIPEDTEAANEFDYPFIMMEDEGPGGGPGGGGPGGGF